MTTRSRGLDARNVPAGQTTSRTKLRSSIERFLVKNKYPPDKQPGAIALVLEQMERLAPRSVDAA